MGPRKSNAKGARRLGASGLPGAWLCQGVTVVRATSSPAAGVSWIRNVVPRCGVKVAWVHEPLR